MVALILVVSLVSCVGPGGGGYWYYDADHHRMWNDGRGYHGGHDGRGGHQEAPHGGGRR